jgi:UDP-2,4-diacetamido-2,4,6-trideoxy-beta-L-altropyranose hydrolase
LIKKRVVFRADGSEIIGLGHIMRVLSIIELLKDNFICLLILNKPDQKVRDLVASFCPVVLFDSADYKEEVNKLQDYLMPNDILVTDGYQFDECYQREVRKMVYKLLVVDDNAAFFFHADAIINHGGLLGIPSYRLNKYTKVFSGFSYLIARKQFLNAALQNRHIEVVDTAFICMGGADPFQITIKALEACAQCLFIKNIIIVTGSFFFDNLRLQTLIEGITHQKVYCYENASAEEMVRFIQSSQLAFSTASSIAMEICCVKAGLITGIVADNQRSIHQQILQNGCGLSVGSWKDVSVETVISLIERLKNSLLINEIMKNQAKSIDGKSGERIVQIFNELAV